MEQQLSELLRPTELADLIQPLELIQRLERMVERRALVNMLFHGKPGLGKTSAARILANKLDADCYETQWLNGNRHRERSRTHRDVLRNSLSIIQCREGLLHRRV